MISKPYLHLLCNQMTENWLWRILFSVLHKYEWDPTNQPWRRSDDWKYNSASDNIVRCMNLHLIIQQSLESQVTLLRRIKSDTENAKAVVLCRFLQVMSCFLCLQSDSKRTETERSSLVDLKALENIAKKLQSVIQLLDLFLRRRSGRVSFSYREENIIQWQRNYYLQQRVLLLPKCCCCSNGIRNNDRKIEGKSWLWIF